MQKITKVSPGWGGHLHLELEDHSKVVLNRGDHEHHDLKPGDMWPPEAPGKEEPNGEAERSGA